MAKRKKSKESTTKTFQYSTELNGLLVILLGIMGVGGKNIFGPVGKIVREFAVFLTGTWYIVLVLSVLVLGIYMVTKRKMPKFFSARLIGFYLLMLAILIFSHLEYTTDITLSIKEMLEQTIENSYDYSPNVGGGVIGALFLIFFTKLFSVSGTKIVITVIALFGFLMMFDITLSDIFSPIINMFKKIKLPKKDLNKNSEETDYVKPEDDKIIINSVEELKNSYNTVETDEDYTNSTKSVESSSSNSNYKLPSVNILDNPKIDKNKNSNDFTRSNKQILERVLDDFQVPGKVVEIHIGPAVTQYEVKIDSGTKVSRISSIKDEIKLALAAKEIRIQAPIPGKSTIGVEVPNPYISEVRIKEILTTIPKGFENSKLLVSLGKDIMGRSQLADLSKMPHLLVAGSTGSGKSVCINSFIISLLMRYKPDEVKLVLVDPKKVELSNYNGVPHLLYPVVTDPKKASIALKKIVEEMEKRYELFSEYHVKNISSYNDYVEKENKKRPDSGLKKMLYYVVIIDELADLMLIAAKEVEDSIMRITQMARAAGIHLIVATQRPSTDVITGVVKANIPSRISFAVSSYIDSRTILDMSGAEKLLGKGDMLYLPMGENAPIRIQGSFISDDEIRRVIDYVCKEQAADYSEGLSKFDSPTEIPRAGEEKEEYDDPLYNEIVDFAVHTGKISASLLQRKYRLGYNRAARIVDLLEERGIIGPKNGSKPREVLVKLAKDENEEE